MTSGLWGLSRKVAPNGGLKATATDETAKEENSQISSDISAWANDRPDADRHGLRRSPADVSPPTRRHAHNTAGYSIPVQRERATMTFYVLFFSLFLLSLQSI